MPIYDFKCLSCEGQFSEYVSMTEELEECKLCGNIGIEKLVGKISSGVDKKNYRSKAGDLVKSHIEETKKEIKKEKDSLKSRKF